MLRVFLFYRRMMFYSILETVFLQKQGLKLSKFMLTDLRFNDIISEVEKIEYADVSELADETDSKSVVLMEVWVRIPPSAVINLRRTVGFFMLIFRKAGN